MRADYKYSIKELATRLAQQADTVAMYLLPKGSRVGQEWVVGNIHGEAGQSLRIRLAGDRAGIWKDFATADFSGDLVELWHLVRDISKEDAIGEICDYLKIAGKKPLHSPSKNIQKELVTDAKPSAIPAKPISREYHQTLKLNLKKNGAAIAYLTGETRGLTIETIEYFGLGLSGAYKRGDGTITENAVVAPMRSPQSGQFLNKSAYICVPGVTRNPTDLNGWMKGEPQCYYSAAIGRQSVLFICEGLKDIWRHWQALEEFELTDRIFLVSSTDGSAIPREWMSDLFWRPWSMIYLGHDNDAAGDRIAERVLEYAGREVRRIRVATELGKDWTDFWQKGGTLRIFTELLDNAPVASAATVDAPPTSSQMPRIGRFSHKPVDINGAYANGHLYYPTTTHVIKKDEESGQIVERLETIVIRSDRSVHRATMAPAPAGTPKNDRVLKLTDGTVIEKEPRASSHRTWDYESIQCYLDGKSSNRPLAAIVSDILGFLRQSIWLPYDEDYVALALTVPVTYLQTVFESVPLLLMNGPPESGKSQTGNAMAKMCANGFVIGQVSAATAARLIDETRGFVVLDDVESIAAKAGKDIQANEFVQALKVSYNKHTAVKFWTDVKSMKTERLDFYGVKLLSNTLGAESILATRMIRIQTRSMPKGMESILRDFSVEDLVLIRALRNELHTWAFQNVRVVEESYRKVYEIKTDRHAEITAPLRVTAKLVGDSVIVGQLEACLARQHSQQQAFNDDPVDSLKESVRNLIKQGFDTVTLTHLQLEMRALFDANYGMSNTTEIPEWDRPEWIGRQLRSNDLLENVEPGRKRFYGKNLRLVTFSNWIVKSVMDDFDESGAPIYGTPSKKPEDFCKGCGSCTYRTAGCELQELRVRDENRKRGSNTTGRK